MAHPHAKRVYLPELGPDAWMLVENPWNLPQPRALPRMLTTPEVPPPGETKGEFRARQIRETLRLDELEKELEMRARAQMSRIVLEWHGVVDFETGEPLPPPREDPTVFDRCGQVVHIALAESVLSIQPGKPWDPTRRQEPPKPQKTPGPSRKRRSTSSSATSEEPVVR